MLVLPWVLLVGSCAANGGRPFRLAATPGPQPPAPAPGPESRPVAEELRAELPKVKRLTKVPVLLPGELPHSPGGEALYAYSEAGADEYNITLGTEPECGANACLVGTFQARRGEEPPEADEVDKVVDLAGGVKGFYTAKSCGASCAPPQIEWMYEGVLYTLQFKVGGKDGREDEEKILALANSAISSGPR